MSVPLRLAVTGRPTRPREQSWGSRSDNSSWTHWAQVRDVCSAPLTSLRIAPFSQPAGTPLLLPGTRVFIPTTSRRGTWKRGDLGPRVDVSASYRELRTEAGAGVEEEEEEDDGEGGNRVTVLGEETGKSLACFA